MEDNKLVASSYGEPASTQHYERASWTEFEMFRRSDGSTWRRFRECSRWGGLYQTNIKWIEEELT